VARFARVYPLYLVVLAWPTVQMWAADSLPKKELLQHVLAVQAWSGDSGVAFRFVGPAWSISVELFLYATLPLLVPLIRLIDRRLWMIVAAVVLVFASLMAIAFFFEYTGRGALAWDDPASSHRWLYRTPLLRVGDFLLGILAARLFLRLRHRRTAGRTGHWLIVTGIAAAIILAAQPSLMFSTWSWDAIYAPCGTSVILGLALAPRHAVSRLLALPLITFLGEASFAFYLSHVAVLKLTRAGSWSSGVSLETLALEGTILAFATALAIGLHVSIEKPARIFLKRLLDRSRPASAQPADVMAPHAAAQHPQAAKARELVSL
jgi:peptidoglycan/LPS O-acetylase OafA/YrhL